MATDDVNDRPDIGPQRWRLERLDAIQIELAADADTVLLTQESPMGEEDRIQVPTLFLPHLIERLQEVLAESQARKARQP